MNIDKKTKAENVLSVMGTILNEWKRGGDACTMEEFEGLYEDVTELLGEEK